MDKLDQDIQFLDKNGLKTEIERLRNVIRKHRDAKGHDRCWENDVELYSSLPEKQIPDPKIPEWCEFMQNCAKYRAGYDKREIK